MTQKGNSSLFKHLEFIIITKIIAYLATIQSLFYAFLEKIIKHLSIICKITIANTSVFEEPGNR